MKRVALLHTVKGVLNTFEDDLRRAIPEELAVSNTLDDYLANDPNIRGEFTQKNLNRLLFDLKAAELTDPDLIVVTCSTLTPWVEKLRPLISVPVVAIDDAMSRTAVGLGEKVYILATARSTAGPTERKLLADAAAAGKRIHTTVAVCDEAFAALKRLDMETHDRLLKEAALEIKNQDVVVLAQASMAHLTGEIEKICGCRVLSSPSLCIAQVKELLAKGE